MIFKMTILRHLGSSDDKEKEKIGIARPEGKQSTPGGMQGSKFLLFVSLSYPIYFRATSVHDII